MKYLLAVLFSVVAVFHVACLSEEEQYRYDQQKQQEERQVQICREYLSQCDYRVTNMFDKHGYQTDNYTIDMHGNLVMSKCVKVVDPDGNSDYTIYTNRMLISVGAYMVETIK
jgi:hypothetical protein